MSLIRTSGNGVEVGNVANVSQLHEDIWRDSDASMTRKCE